MESYADRFRGVVIALIVFFTGITGGVYSQQNETNRQGQNQPSQFYSHINAGFSVNSTRLINQHDSLGGFRYANGVGLSLEKEIFFKPEFALIAGGGIRYMRSIAKADYMLCKIWGARLQIGAKYFVFPRLALNLGFNGYYALSQQYKTTYISTEWGKSSFVDQYQYGGYAGLDLYMNDWAILRPEFIMYKQSLCFEIGLIITPDYIF